MTGRIGFTDVGLDFDDGAAGRHTSTTVHQDFPEQIARDVERRSIVESARKFQCL
jgi:hypothetical protein